MNEELFGHLVYYVFFAIPGAYVVAAWRRSWQEPRDSEAGRVRRVLTVSCLALLSINALMLLTIPDALGYIAEAIGHARGWPPGRANDGALRACAAFGSLFALSGTIAAGFIRKSSRLLAATAGIMQVYLYFFYVSAAV